MNLESDAITNPFLPPRVELCQNFELETKRIETDLDPTKSLVKDAVALNMLRLEACLNDVQGYITRPRATMAKIGK